MKAVRWHGRGDVRLEDVPDAPAPGPGQVRVRVAWTGICGTDREEWRTGPHFIQTGPPHPLTGRTAPITLGHEVAGHVEDLGAGVTGLRAGRLVALDGLIHCGRCYWCQRHETVLCRRLASIGFHADGGLAEMVTVEAASALPVPDGVPADTAAFAEPVAVAVRAIRRAQLRPGEVVAVVGTGMIAIAAMRVARAAGAESISIVSRSEPRRRRAMTLGADTTFDPAAPELPMRLEASYLGGGADVVIEASGGTRSVVDALSVARRGGRVVLVGLPAHQPSIVMSDLVASERTIIGSLSHVWDEDFAGALRLLGDGLLTATEVDPLRITLADAVVAGLAAADVDSVGHLKTLVSPTDLPIT